MRRVLTLRVILLVALLFSLVRVVVSHSAHLGPVEWLIVVLILYALLAALLRSPRRTA
jgi:hypothetical protein